MMMMVPTLAAFSADSALDNLSRIAVFLLMLSILVVLHEFGHFIVARLQSACASTTSPSASVRRC